MEKVQNVLIVGAGITGLTLARALRLKGISAEVVELKSDVRSQPGVGLSMQGNSIAALGRIGLSAAVLRSSIPGCYLNMRRPDGTFIAHQPIMQMGGRGFPSTAGISRSTLHEILLDGALQSGAKIRFGVTSDAIDDRGDSVSVRFTDGSSGRYDLVVGADGLYSKVRGLLFPDFNPRYLGQSVWRAGVKRMLGNYTTELHLGGPFGVVGLCPISESEGYLYLIETAAPGTRHPDDDLASVLTEKLIPYSSALVRDAVDQLPESRSISFRPLEALLVDESWFKGRVGIVGDAAHCGPPVLAQGAAMGMEDAVVLADVLSGGGVMPEILAGFMERRLPRASLVVNTSVQLCEWEVNHSASPQDVGRVMREAQADLCQPF